MLCNMTQLEVSTDALAFEAKIIVLQYTDIRFSTVLGQFIGEPSVKRHIIIYASTVSEKSILMFHPTVSIN